VEAIHDYIAQDSRPAAEKWLRGFYAKARSLRSNPLLYEVAPDTEEIGLPRRHFVYGQYRVIYRVTGRQVIVIRVLHGARLLTPEMLQEEP
jgi:toxin ParE1/3/4